MSDQNSDKVPKWKIASLVQGCKIKLINDGLVQGIFMGFTVPAAHQWSYSLGLVGQDSPGFLRSLVQRARKVYSENFMRKFHLKKYCDGENYQLFKAIENDF